MQYNAIDLTIWLHKKILIRHYEFGAEDKIGRCEKFILACRNDFKAGPLPWFGFGVIFDFS